MSRNKSENGHRVCEITSVGKRRGVVKSICGQLTDRNGVAYRKERLVIFKEELVVVEQHICQQKYRS